MNRRSFISNSLLLSASSLFLTHLPLRAELAYHKTAANDELYDIFRDPDSSYYPFVRWWWNGNKLEAAELKRELHLLKKAGIGGVEINPIEFPSRQEGDDLGKKSLRWLSKEWIRMLQHSFAEAGKLDMSCDLIVGSGWPFGAETLKPDERASVMLVNAIELHGPQHYEISRFTIFRDVDPAVTVQYPGRTFDLVALRLVPDPMSSLNEVSDLGEMVNDELLNIDVPEGKHFLYALVRVDSFASVINGAPGAAGPILNHMDKKAVAEYLKHMSGTIEKETGPLSHHLRAFFTDSMELEGSNWTDDFADVFISRRGYDIMPWLPFVMFRVGRLGGVVDFEYGAKKKPELSEQVERIRYDFELTKAELLNERFTKTFLQWCKDQDVLSRAQSYGRGFFPLASSLGYDIPEGESWTTNWLKHKVGVEMPDNDYRRGRAYTMINKYVSSAAHLQGRRIISCEEMTNTYLVFNTSLELLKVGSDQSVMSGTTHPVWHGFNYSPPEAPYPGWIQYGSYYNENNNWWPYFIHLNKYRARISSLLQNSVMYTDIAILPPNNDLWSELGVQTDPFPERLNVEYTSLIWEALNKNGAAADYITSIILRGSEIKNGLICYGPKKFPLLIMPEVSSIDPDNLAKILEFVSGGGKVLCIGKYPERAPGFKDYKERDEKVKALVKQLRKYDKNFILIKKPDNRSYLEWFSELIREYSIPRYTEIDDPDPFLMQTRYQADKGNEIIIFANSHLRKKHETGIRFSGTINRSGYAWIWDPQTGKRFRTIPEEDESYRLVLGPAETRIYVFDQQEKGKQWKMIPDTGTDVRKLGGPWDIEFIHCRGKKYGSARFEKLYDLKDTTKYKDFSGTVIYRKSIFLDEPLPEYINLGNVHDISEVIINNKDAGLRWYGNHIYDIADLLHKGTNTVEIRVITLMGNYMKSLTDNPNAQYWTNLDRKNQPIVSMGLTGPVRLYK